jgi:hypothetical protein
VRMIRPKLDAPQVTIAEEQEGFKPVTAAIVRHPSYNAVRCRIAGETETCEANSLVLAFRPTDEERRRIAEGEDIYVSLLTFMHPMQGIILSVGPEHFAGSYGVAVEP